MHRQLIDWYNKRPFTGIRVLHHVPVVPNTLLKIACLIEAGAEVTVTNPSFLSANSKAVASLRAAGVRYPEFYMHNIAGLVLIQKLLSNGIHGLPMEIDQPIIHQWCQYHSFAPEIITQWFIDHRDSSSKQLI